MENITSTDYANPPLEIGDNYHETATVVVPASTTLAKGTVLVRNAGGKFEPVAVTTSGGTTTSTLVNGAGLAVVVEEITNAGTSAADVYCRVMISGRVNRNQLTAAGNAITDAETDILRGQDIIAIPVHTV